MKRQVAIALCVLTMCSLCIFELILVTISIRQHVLYDRATCVSEGGGALCQMLGALIVFVRFSFFRLLERIGFCYFGKSDSCDNSERLGNAELSCALYGALLNLINPLSVVCVVGIFDASYMHYFWMITPLWICGVVLLGKKRRMEGLQLTAGKSADRSWAAHQSMIDCFARCRSLSGIDLLAILLTAVLAMLVGYIAHEGMKEWCGSSDDDVVAQSQVKKLPPPVINRKIPSPPHRKMLQAPTLARHVASQIESEERMNLRVSAEEIDPGTSPAELASEKNQVMDELLNQPQIPSDYADVMIGLCRDKSQDVLTRDFAVQHIGLYAQALERRGEYDAEAAESRKLRAALFDAAGETRSIVAAAAFRALADMSEFDSRIDARRLNSLLSRCAADSSSAPAARAMAVQLCGERRVSAARFALESILDDGSAPEVLRSSARCALDSINGKEISQ